MAYEFLADWFEYLNDDCDYAKWSQYFIAGLAKYGAGKKGLELGCGSGAFCRALQKAGYEMSGADNCVSMLTKAEALARKENLRIPFFFADAASLASPEKYDFILSPNDVFNYLPGEKLLPAFRKISSRLRPRGLLWLDVSSSYKLREKVGNTVSCDDREEVTYLCFNHLKNDRIEMDVTLFLRQKDGLYARRDERHVQYIHEEEALLSAVSEGGFEVLSVEGHLGEEKQNSDRLNVICRKM